MKQSIKAALLSGLLFPGLGHLSLKQRKRGWILIWTSLLAIVAMVVIATQQALAVVDDMMTGDVPLDSASITQMIDASSSGTLEMLANGCLLILLGCWLFGIIDSFRLGALQDKLSGEAS